jgi:ribosome biogenesis protein ERB1
VIVWEIATTRVYKRFQLDELPMCVAWCPNVQTNVLAVAAGSRVLLLKPGTSSAAAETELETLLTLKRADAERESAWQRTSEVETAAGIVLQIRHQKPVQSIAWHHRGDYFAAVCPGSKKQMLYFISISISFFVSFSLLIRPSVNLISILSVFSSAGKTQVRIHQLSKQYSQYPFSKGKGRVEAVQFHPSKPELFVATQRCKRRRERERERGEGGPSFLIYLVSLD